MTDDEKKALTDKLAALKKQLANAQAVAVKAEGEVRGLKRQIEDMTRPFLAKG